jgi:hypothetical protein
MQNSNTEESQENKEAFGYSKIAKKFYTSGSTTTLVQYTADALRDTLEAAIYELRFSPMMGYYLVRQAQQYDVPKLYGSVLKRAHKIMNTFSLREKSTGVLLSGDKGTGKSLLSMVIANMSVIQGNPVIIIKNSFYGSDFEELINAIPNAVLVFDEFGKTYKTSKDGDDNPQEKLLSFFDGQGAKKRLMVFTENQTTGINEFMLNRPGRIYYHYRYSKLEVEVIEEYCTEMGITKDNIALIQNFSMNTREFSFDVLKAIVEESLRYPEDSIQELIGELNISTGDSSKNIEIVSIMDENGEQYTPLEGTGKISYHSSHYSKILPKDPVKRATVLEKAASRLAAELEEHPESGYKVEDCIDTSVSVSLRSMVMTVKNGVTYIKYEGYIIGYKEKVAIYANYSGFIGEY